MTIFRHIVHFLYPFEEFSYRCFVEKGHAEDAKYIKSASIKSEIVFNNSNKAIGCDCRENLDSNRIFCYTPERLYMQMLLDPFKKQFHLPSVFIKQGNMFCADFKFFGNSFFLCDRYHLVCKFLKNLAVPVCICLGKIASCYHGFAEPKMVRLRRMCSNYADKLSKAITAGQLAIHHDQQLVPAAKRLDVFVSPVFHNDSLKCFLWQKFDELCKNIFPDVLNPKFTFAFKSINSNRGHAFLNISCINSEYYKNKF